MVDESTSLTLALQHICRDAGLVIGFDDLHAALGLSMTTCAVPDEEEVETWPAYGRDLFLVEAGRLFGLTIRAVHPPAAARGLHRSREFTQHFDASYRPLILRALEHGQPVLAWRGWGVRREAMWGVITGTAPSGSGFVGTVAWDSSTVDADAEALLATPPSQLYIVEAVTPVVPMDDVLLEVSLDHARAVLNNEGGEPFGVVTGPPAFDAWITRLTAATAAVTSVPENLTGHRQMAASVVAGHESAQRFLDRHLPRSSPETYPLLETLRRLTRSVVVVLSESNDEDHPGPEDDPAQAWAKFVGQVTRARDAAADMQAALAERGSSPS